MKKKKSLVCLKEIAKKVTSTELRKQVVFALQLSDMPEASAEMIMIAKTDVNREVRKNAIFWLGQTGDERAIKFFEEILLKK